MNNIPPDINNMDVFEMTHDNFNNDTDGEIIEIVSALFEHAPASRSLTSLTSHEGSSSSNSDFEVIDCKAVDLWDETKGTPTSTYDEESTDSNIGFHEVEFRNFDVWDDVSDLSDEDKTKEIKEKTKPINVKAGCSTELATVTKDIVVFTQISNLPNDPRVSRLYVNPTGLTALVEMLDGLMPQISRPVPCDTLLPWKPQTSRAVPFHTLLTWKPRGQYGNDGDISRAKVGKSRNKVNKPMAKTGKPFNVFKTLHRTSQKKMTKLKTELESTQDILELKTWMLETLGEELRMACHEKETLRTTNTRLVTEKHNLQENLTAEIAEVQSILAFTQTVESGVEDLIYNLASCDMVKITDHNGNEMFVKRKPQPVIKSNWMEVKTRKNEVRFLAIVSGLEDTIELLQEQNEKLECKTKKKLKKLKKKLQYSDNVINLKSKQLQFDEQYQKRLECMIHDICIRQLKLLQGRNSDTRPSEDLFQSCDSYTRLSEELLQSRGSDTGLFEELLQSRDSDTRLFEELLQSRDSDTGLFEEQLQSRDSDTRLFEELLQSRDRLFEELLQSRDSNIGLRKELLQSHNSIGLFEEQIQCRDDYIGQLQHKTADLEAKLLQLQYDNDYIRGQLQVTSEQCRKATNTWCTNATQTTDIHVPTNTRRPNATQTTDIHVPTNTHRPNITQTTNTQAILSQLQRKPAYHSDTCKCVVNTQDTDTCSVAARPLGAESPRAERPVTLGPHNWASTLYSVKNLVCNLARFWDMDGLDSPDAEAAPATASDAVDPEDLAQASNRMASLMQFQEPQHLGGFGTDRNVYPKLLPHAEDLLEQYDVAAAKNEKNMEKTKRRSKKMEQKKQQVTDSTTAAPSQGVQSPLALTAMEATSPTRMRVLGRKRCSRFKPYRGYLPRY